MTPATPETLAKELHAVIDDLPEAGYDDQLDRAHSLVDDLAELAFSTADKDRILTFAVDAAIAWRNGNVSAYLDAIGGLQDVLEHSPARTGVTA